MRQTKDDLINIIGILFVFTIALFLVDRWSVRWIERDKILNSCILANKGMPDLVTYCKVWTRKILGVGDE